MREIKKSTTKNPYKPVQSRTNSKQTRTNSIQSHCNQNKGQKEQHPLSTNPTAHKNQQPSK